MGADCAFGDDTVRYFTSFELLTIARDPPAGELIEAAVRQLLARAPSEQL